MIHRPRVRRLALFSGGEAGTDAQGCDLVALTAQDLEPVVIEDEGLPRIGNGLGLMDHQTGDRDPLIIG